MKGVRACTQLVRTFCRAHIDGDLSLWKADIDSAYRRIPVAPAHRHLAWITFVHNGQTLAAGHNALPFGSVASVYHWDRVGELVKAIARRVSCAYTNN